VDEAVADRVGDGRIHEGLVPTFRRQLRRDHGGGAVVSILEYLEKVASFGVLERPDEQVVASCRTAALSSSRPASQTASSSEASTASRASLRRRPRRRLSRSVHSRSTIRPPPLLLGPRVAENRLEASPPLAC
jgi:hypothetical protein